MTNDLMLQRAVQTAYNFCLGWRIISRDEEGTTEENTVSAEELAMKVKSQFIEFHPNDFDEFIAFHIMSLILTENRYDFEQYDAQAIFKKLLK